MKKFFEDLEFFDDFNSIACEICYENFSKDKPAQIMKCGHSICKGCLNNLIKTNQLLCSKCRIPKEKEEKKDMFNYKDINTNELYWENTIINDLIDLSKMLNIDVDVFLSFPLNFKYCEKCDLFITNYSFYYHQKQQKEHKLQSFEKKLTNFFRKYNLSKKDNLVDDKNKFMIIFLYFYQSPFLHKIKFFEPSKTILLSNGEYKFYGQFLSYNENVFFSNIAMKKKEKFAKWHKGALINRNEGIIIHGYFCFQFQSETNIFLYPIIFGLFSYDKIKFFGFIKINKKNINNEVKLDISDFIFECGLLYDQNYYFGEFNEYYFNDIKKEQKKDNDNVNYQTIIKKGEVIIVKEEGVEIKRIIPHVENIIPEIPEKPETLIVDNNNTDNKNIEYEVEIVNSKILIKKHEEKITISPLNRTINDCNYNLHESKINISKYNKTIIFRFDSKNSEYSIIVFDGVLGTINKKSEIREGFLLTFINGNLMDNFKSLTLQKIIDDINKKDYTFIENINNLFEIEVKDCKIKCISFEIKDNLIKERKGIYYEIEENQIIEIKKNRNSVIIHKIHEKIIKIKDLFNANLNTIFNFNDIRDKHKDDSCCSMI